MHENDLEKLHGLLKKFDTAMLTTRGAGGLRARPMAIAQTDPDGGLWFFTGRESGKVHEIESNPDVLIVCQSDHSRYLSLQGKARVVEDRTLAQRLWRETFRTWFPQGVDDPNLALIEVRIREAEYWDNQGVKAIRYFLEAAKAYASGTTPKVREGEQHGKIAVA